jgi:hypothetical protein
MLDSLGYELTVIVVPESQSIHYDSCWLHGMIFIIQRSERPSRILFGRRCSSAEGVCMHGMSHAYAPLVWRSGCSPPSACSFSFP